VSAFCDEACQLEQLPEFGPLDGVVSVSVCQSEQPHQHAITNIDLQIIED